MSSAGRRCVVPALGLGMVALSLAACGSPGGAGEAEAARGAAAIAAADCGVCHVIPGIAGARGHVGPSLEEFGRRSYIAGRYRNDRATLARWIQDPPALKPSTGMPALGIEPEVASDMAAFLEGLR